MASKIPITTAQFIEKAVNKFGNKYDYSLVVYTHSKTKIKIICRIHGVYEQTPQMHLIGQSCPKCAIESIREKAKTHGLYKRCVYKLWTRIKDRCYNPKNKNYNTYGEKGIKLSDEFHDYLKFEEYLIGLPDYDKRESLGYSLDRIDVNGNYERGNLRWASQSVQCSNKRKSRVGGNKYVGVYKKYNWLFKVCINGKTFQQGGFDTELAALSARNEYIEKHNLPHKIQK